MAKTCFLASSRRVWQAAANRNQRTAAAGEGKSCHAPKWVKRAAVAHVAYTQCARVYIIKKAGKTKRNETANEIENENKNMGKSAAHKNVAQRVVHSALHNVCTLFECVSHTLWTYPWKLIWHFDAAHVFQLPVANYRPTQGNCRLRVSIIDMQTVSMRPTQKKHTPKKKPP